MNKLEIKLIDGSIMLIEKEYIWMEDIYKDLNNISEFIKIDDYIICKNEIRSIRKISKEENND